MAPGLIVAWTVTAFVLSQLTGVGDQDSDLVTKLGRALMIGGLVGLASAWLESGPLVAWSRRLPLWAALGVRTLSYALVVTLTFAVAIVSLSWVERGMTPRELTSNAQLLAFLTSRPFRAFALLLTLSSFVISFGLQLRRVLGPETLRALFLGTYRRPVREERAFAFLDLSDSTAWAERLGPLRFTEFKNDFFADVAEPVLATGGRIVQYVGDEVMVSWPMRRAEATAAPVRFFFLVQDRIDAHAARYRRRYGDVPRFKAGVHGGEVVTAEVGDLKRDIVHSGDVVNTAARIEGECRPRGERLLVSQAMLDRMPALGGWTVEPLGALALRGKARTVGVSAVRSD
jgi:adenylate cyclase